MTRFIFVTGGVISGVGKGVIAASLGKIMKEYGLKTTLIKMDPYINYDAGTLRPTEHGEVWVTHDGGEIDQDLGTYERFLDQTILKHNNITTGQIYKAVIDRERRGEYLGQTVQFFPHIVDEVKQRILKASDGYDIAVVELGGTVGDYENVPYLFAMKALEREFGSSSIAYILVTYLPVPEHIQEMKTKPTQQAVRLLGQEGIHPTFLICRSQHALDLVRKQKIEACSNIPVEKIISAPDLPSVYDMPLYLQQESLGDKILRHFGIDQQVMPLELTQWQQLVQVIKHPQKQVRIGIVGKYLHVGDYSLIDSYLSIYQALVHAAAHVHVGVSISWINATDFETDLHSYDQLISCDAVLVPGGFGATGVEGKINAIGYARKNRVPFLGICYGMQLAIVEYARSVCGFKGAHTTEVDPSAAYPVIDLLPEQRHVDTVGGTMRLGAYAARVSSTSHMYQLYNQAGRIELIDGQPNILERHRHRYEVNPLFVNQLEEAGLIFSAHHTRADGTRLMECIELADHPFFMATQAHPEFTSSLTNPNPLFKGFITAALEHQRRKNDVTQDDSASANTIIGARVAPHWELI